MHAPFPSAARKCPTCRVELTNSERRGVRTCLCPQCKGVWLDEGALDMLIERIAPPAAPAPPPPRELGGGGGWLGHFQFPSPERGFGRKSEPADC